jgi:hypothetical protein
MIDIALVNNHQVNICLHLPASSIADVDLPRAVTGRLQQRWQIAGSFILVCCLRTSDLRKFGSPMFRYLS